MSVTWKGIKSFLEYLREVLGCVGKRVYLMEKVERGSGVLFKVKKGLLIIIFSISGGNVRVLWLAQVSQGSHRS